MRTALTLSSLSHVCVNVFAALQAKRQLWCSNTVWAQFPMEAWPVQISVPC